MPSTTTNSPADLLTHARIHARWPELGAEDLATIDGDPGYLVQALERHGREPARAQLEVDAWVAAHAGGRYDALAEARALFAPPVSQLCEGMRGIGSGVRVLARDLFAEGRERVSDGAERAEAGIDTAKAAAAGALAPVGRFVKERPITALAIAVAAGWLIARRR